MQWNAQCMNSTGSATVDDGVSVAHSKFPDEDVTKLYLFWINVAADSDRNQINKHDSMNEEANPVFMALICMLLC
jgi:hypothetical protein